MKKYCVCKLGNYLLLLVVVFQKAEDWFGDEAGDADAGGGAEAGEDVAAGVSEAAHYADGIGLDVVAEEGPVDEGLEIAVHKGLDVGIVVMGKDKRRKAAEVSRRGSGTVDALHYGRVGGVELRLEILRDIRRNKSLDIVGQEQFSESGTAAFVTEDKSSRIDFALDAFTIVEAGV